MSVALAVPAATQAHLAVFMYSLDDSQCMPYYNSPDDTNHKDPIGVIFYDLRQSSQPRYASGVTALDHVQHGGWSNRDSDNQQYFKSHASCQISRGSVWRDVGSYRYHMRAAPTYDWGENYGYSAVGTPHYEQSVPNDCTWWNPFDSTHAVLPNSGSGSGYDIARNELYNSALNHGHARQIQYKGNTLLMRQCYGGWLAGSNGNVLYVHIG